MATPTEMLLVFAALLFADIVYGRNSCPRRYEVENCTAVHKAAFNNIIRVHGSLLGGVEIADLHKLCDSYTKALRCIHRLESACAKNASAKVKSSPLYNISSLCPNRGSSTIETYSLHHSTCFLKPDVKKEITDCWNHFETTVGQGNKLMPKSLLNSASKKRSSQDAASLRTADSADRQIVTTAVCKLHACLEDAIVARCYPGANVLMSSLALPLPPFSLQQYSTNCTLHLQSAKQHVSEQQDVKKRISEKQLSTLSPDSVSAGRPRKVNRQAITASGLSSVGLATFRSAWWLTHVSVSCSVLILAKWL